MSFRTGDLVYDVADPRHVGRIYTTFIGISANVQWLETGFKSHRIPLGDLRHAEPEPVEAIDFRAVLETADEEPCVTGRNWRSRPLSQEERNSIGRPARGVR